MSTHFTKADLKHRHWSGKLIKELLGCEAVQPFDSVKVLEAERSEAFKLFQFMRRAFIEETKQNVERNKRLILAFIEDSPIRVPRFSSMDELYAKAIASWEEKELTRSGLTWDKLITKTEGKIVEQRDTFAVNYLRAELKPYWKRVEAELNLESGFAVAKDFMNDIFLDEIAKAYPQLDEVCNAQCLAVRKANQAKLRLQT